MNRPTVGGVGVSPGLVDGIDCQWRLCLELPDLWSLLLSRDRDERQRAGEAVVGRQFRRLADAVDRQVLAGDVGLTAEG